MPNRRLPQQKKRLKIYAEPKAPFGGFKQSGIGRKHGVYGLEEYMEPKVIFGHEI
jgi:aldehyde dehydrogenase (NAD+)